MLFGCHLELCPQMKTIMKEVAEAELAKMKFAQVIVALGLSI